MREVRGRLIPIFDINEIAFVILNYPISWVELIGTVFGFISVYLTAKNKVSGFPVGIVNIIFFIILFYQIQLYSDVFLNIYFLIGTFYGWYLWTHPKDGLEASKTNELKVTILSKKLLIFWICFTAITSIIIGIFTANVHTLLLDIFIQPASFPYLDTFTTVLSIVATVLMAQKKIEAWILWITADVIDICLYSIKGVQLVAIEYIIFLILAISGLYTWLKEYKTYKKQPNVI